MSRTSDVQQHSNELEQELSQQHDFIAMIAHQVNAGLAGMKWALDMLKNGDVGNLSPEQQKLVERTAITNDRMIHIIQDLRSASKDSTWELSSNKTVCDLNELVTDAIEHALHSTPLTSDELAFENSTSSPCLTELDTKNMMMVLDNLLDNAVKYRTDSSPVTVNLSCQNEQAMLSVHNQGTTTEPDETEKIFGKFYRGSKVNHTDKPGSGLGLFTVKHIVEEHGGNVSYESNEDHGTTITIQLPLAS